MVSFSSVHSLLMTCPNDYTVLNYSFSIFQKHAYYLLRVQSAFLHVLEICVVVTLNVPHLGPVLLTQHLCNPIKVSWSVSIIANGIWCRCFQTASFLHLDDEQFEAVNVIVFPPPFIPHPLVCVEIWHLFFLQSHLQHCKKYRQDWKKTTHVFCCWNTKIQQEMHRKWFQPLILTGSRGLSEHQ